MIKKKTKILHIIKSLGRGGAEMLLPETLKLHDKNKFEFHYIYFLPWKDQMVEALVLHGGVVTCIAANNNIQLMLKVNRVIRYVRENDIELIHGHLPWAGVLARIVGKQIGVPVVYTEHNKLERYHFATRWINIVTMNAVQELIAVSDDVSQSILKWKPNLKARLRTVVNGVNTGHFNPEHHYESIRASLRIPANAPVIGTIAVFRFQKRLDIWMDIASRILEKHEDAHFIIVGDGPLKEDLLKKRDALGLTDRIHLPGLKTEVRPYLFAFDLYMMSSVFEGLPVALLEAMAMKCAIVSTDAGGIKEVVRHEMEGLLCPVGAPQKLVEHACYLLARNDMRIQFGEHARDRVLAAFSMEKMVDELEHLYTEMV